MGSELFIHVAKGKTAQIAFDAAVEEAAYAHGHSGYTGTIAEKESFIEIPLPEKFSRTKQKKGESLEDYASRYAEWLLGKSDDRVDDKWGPAGCLKIKRGSYLFFGWAST